MGMIDRRGALVVLACLSLVGACLDGDEAETGTVGVNLVGQGASGATYRLRDATITVAGPASTIVWNTEDDPNRTSLSANVVVGNYTATLAPGWRLERLVTGQPPVDVTATLTSPNPVAFTVVPMMRTVVPFTFEVDGGVVDMSQGYDIVIDIDEVVTVPNIITMPSSLSLNEGATVAIAVRLSSAPAAPIVVQVTSSDPSVAIASPPMLLFTPANFATPQLVNVAASQDADLLDETAVLAFSAAGLPTANVVVTVTDDDAQFIQTTANTLTVIEGGIASFGVRLAAQPPGPVPVQIVSSDPSAANVVPTVLTFTPANYNVFQTVTIAGVQDPDFSNEMVTIALASPGVPTVTVVVLVDDDE
jgi:hypothetical protein